MEDNILLENPFFKKSDILINGKNDKLINFSDVDLFNNFSRLIIVALNDDYDTEINYYKDNLSVEELKLMFENLYFIESNLILIKNLTHKSQLVTMGKYFFDLVKDSKIIFNETELVLPLFNINKTNIKIYLNQYKSKNSLKEYLTLKTMNIFYLNEANNYMYVNNMIKDMDVSNYWTKFKNTKLNLTNKFINREFNLNLSQRIKDTKVKDVLLELKTMPKEGDTYLNYIYRKNTYVDISSIIKNKGYNKYNINNDLEFTFDDINNIIHNLLPSNIYEFYNLTMNLLCSKDYCHLVLKNSYYMNLVTDYLLVKYYVAFQYVLGYTWLTLYSEECIKKSFITENDRFVFDANQASRLPHFPFCSKEMRYNPYVSVLVSDTILNVKENIMGVSINNIDEFGGVWDLCNFQKRFNIFNCSDENVNIFEGVNMKNIGITGSMIPACITKNNPLEKMFISTDRYFKEYYCNSDLDVMCNLECNFEYIDRIYKFFKEVNENCLKYFNENAILEESKVAAIIVNEKYIKKHIVDDQHSYEYILSNLDNHEVLKKFHKKYIEYKIKNNEKYFKSDKWLNCMYNIYFELSSINDIRIVFTNTEDDWNNIISKHKNTELNEEEKNAIDDIDEIIRSNNKTKYDNFKEPNNVLFRIFENIKFNLKCFKLNHNFEIFKTKYPSSFFSVVCNFHMPCVRGFYNGSNVYLLPSCISAAMTGINIDYKYFAGVRDPIEIVNKYRLRGYSLFLNDNEKIRLISYSSKVEKWNKLYGGIVLKNKENVNKLLLGYLDINNTFFKPRIINKEFYENYKPVKKEDYNVIYSQPDDFYVNKLTKYIFNKKYVSSNESESIYNNLLDKNKIILKLCNLKVINEYGYINQAKKWYFDLIYETLN